MAKSGYYRGTYYANLGLRRRAAIAWRTYGYRGYYWPYFGVTCGNCGRWSYAACRISVTCAGGCACRACNPAGGPCNCGCA